jgi:hypothetical protein
MPSLQDFSLIQTNIQSCMRDFNIEEASNAFYYFALNLILNLQDDEIRDAITILIIYRNMGLQAVMIEELMHFI